MSDNDFITMDRSGAPDHGEVKWVPKPVGNVWDILRKKNHPIETIIPKDIFNSNSPHHYEITNLHSAEVTCMSCPTKHGGYLEPHLLTRYKVENGIIYLDGHAMTKGLPERT